MTATIPTTDAIDAPNEPEVFSLRALIRDEADRSDLADPHDLADAIAQRIPDTELRAAVRALLPAAVREHIRNIRNVAPVRYGEHPGGGSVHGTGNASAKWAGVSEASNDPYRWRVYVSGEWRFLADCTADDCEALASEYDQIAADNAAQAKRFRALVALLADHGAARVGDLPTAEVLEVLER